MVPTAFAPLPMLLAIFWPAGEMPSFPPPDRKIAIETAVATASARMVAAIQRRCTDSHTVDADGAAAVVIAALPTIRAVPRSSRSRWVWGDRKDERPEQSLPLRC